MRSASKPPYPGCGRRPGPGAAAIRSDPDCAFLGERPARVVGNLPHVAVGVGERALRRLEGRPGDRRRAAARGGRLRRGDGAAVRGAVAAVPRVTLATPGRPSTLRCIRPFRAYTAGAVVFASAWTTTPALAHGPCGCLDPVLTRPGGNVRIVGSDGRQAGGRGWPAYRVIFNPRRTDLGIAPSYLTSAYRADGPTRTILSRPRRRPTRKGRFRVPTDAPAGLYMVLIFDGGEGGAHNTWDYLHVTDWDKPDSAGVVTASGAAARIDGAAPHPPASTIPGNAATQWRPWAAALLAAIAVSVWLAMAVVKRRNRRWLA
jgi:hypothetical protein